MYVWYKSLSLSRVFFFLARNLVGIHRRVVYQIDKCVCVFFSEAK